MGRAAASSLQSQGKVALRESLGSLKVPSRRDWDVTSCVGIFLASRSGGLPLCLHASPWHALMWLKVEYQKN